MPAYCKVHALEVSSNSLPLRIAEVTSGLQRRVSDNNMSSVQLVSASLRLLIASLMQKYAFHFM